MAKILIDFDGTVVTHDFPQIGKDIGAVPVLKELIDSGHQLILFTMRSDVEDPVSNDSEIEIVSGLFLTEAVNWFKENGIELYGINTDPEQRFWTSSPKAYGHLIIDDTSLGIPLVYNQHERPFVNWTEVRNLLQIKNYL